MAKNTYKGPVRLLFVLDCLKGGGAQRAVINIIKNLDRANFRINLALIKRTGEFLNEVPEDVKIYDLGCKSARFAIIRLYKVIKEDDPDIILSTLTYINEITYLATRLLSKKIPLIMRSAIVESINSKIEPFIVRILVKKAYCSANKVITLTDTMKRDLIKNYKIPARRIEIIPNMINFDHIRQKSYEDIQEDFITKKRGDIPLLTTIGRLTEQKGIRFLIEGFAQYRRYHDARLLIMGRGELERDLIKLSTDLGIRDDIYFAGFKANPYKYLARSDLFILPSLWEGFPNVLIEAMACGIPVIATNSASGASEIIADSHDGILVPAADSDAIYQAIKTLLGNSELRKGIAKMGYEKAKGFDAKLIIKRYEKIILQIHNLSVSDH